jgi:hypothetical protein
LELYPTPMLIFDTDLAPLEIAAWISTNLWG